MQNKLKLVLAAVLGNGVQTADIVLTAKVVSQSSATRRHLSGGIEVTVEVKAKLASAPAVETAIKASSFQASLQTKAVEQGAITSAAELATDPASSFRVVAITTAAPSKFPTEAPSMDAVNDPPSKFPTK